MRRSHFLSGILLAVNYVYADGNDWVNPSYVVQNAQTTDSLTSSSRNKIISYAGSSARQGPWTVFKGSSILPPSGDQRDYLSWAPYHWPDCNWCTGPRTHLGTGGNTTGSDGEDPSESPDSEDDPDSDDSDVDDQPDDDSTAEDGSDTNAALPNLPLPSETSVSLITPATRIIKRVRRGVMHDVDFQQETLIPSLIPTDLPSTNDLPISDQTSSSMDRVMTQSPNAAEDPVKGGHKSSAKNSPASSTSSKKGSPTQKAHGSDACTPSPTKSLAPSATWTTCPYVVRDGQINPDTRLPNDVNNVVDVTQATLYNAIAYSLSGGSASYAQNVASFIQTFFLDPQNGMYPSVNYGQLIRGPGVQKGQYLGIIDFRGMVKIANAVVLMRQTSAPSWTPTLDSQMVTWTKQYVSWLQTNALAQQASSAPNNHGSFFTNQLSSMNILVEDSSSAASALNAYFTNQFLDQIAASGEQPFEAVRTRPYHYRCFNLEAMITNAKLGDQLGLNFWTTKSKYGATIQNALDYTMALDPGKEDVSDIFPHVVAIANAYGDPSGKYAKFLKANFPTYMSATYWFYNQPGSLNESPASNSQSKKRSGVLYLDSNEVEEATTDVASPTLDVGTPTSLAGFPTPTIPFECPQVFSTSPAVELDDGVYVTCDELKPFYGYVNDVEQQG